MTGAADEAKRTLSGRIAEAFSRRTPLEIRGGGTKRFYGNPPTGEGREILETAGPGGGGGLSKILAYEPSELFVCALAGTPLAVVESALAERGQMLAFEPPHFGAGATLGGATAAGLSGPRRPFSGAVRDCILGVEMADGQGSLLRFGGRVIKNVAGFDLSRLSAGSLGTLGVLTELTFRAVPRPEAELTTALECDATTGIGLANRLLCEGLPLTGTAWHGGVLRLRISGATDAIGRAAKEAGGEILAEDSGRKFWDSIREQSHEFFAGTGPAEPAGSTGPAGGGGGGGEENLWRVGCAPLSPVSAGSQLIEWRGSLRWFRGGRPEAERFARECGGHLTLFRAGENSAGAEDSEESGGGRFPELSPAVFRLHRELKRVFDPADILNRGRMHHFPAA